jgi:hypothetical protein
MVSSPFSLPIFRILLQPTLKPNMIMHKRNNRQRRHEINRSRLPIRHNNRRNPANQETQMTPLFSLSNKQRRLRRRNVSNVPYVESMRQPEPDEASNSLTDADKPTSDVAPLHVPTLATQKRKNPLKSSGKLNHNSGSAILTNCIEYCAFPAGQ